MFDNGQNWSAFWVYNLSNWNAKNGKWYIWLSGDNRCFGRCYFFAKILIENIFFIYLDDIVHLAMLIWFAYNGWSFENDPKMSVVAKSKWHLSGICRYLFIL